MSFCLLFIPTYTKAKNSCATTVRRDIKVELCPTALQAFKGGILAHLIQFYRTRACLSERRTELPIHRAWQKEKTKREHQSTSAKSPPPTAGYNKMLLIEFTSTRKKLVVFF